MTVVLNIPEEIEASLRRRAAASGESIDAIAFRLLSQAMHADLQNGEEADDASLDYSPPPAIQSRQCEVIMTAGRQIDPLPYDPILDEE